METGLSTSLPSPPRFGSRTNNDERCFHALHGIFHSIREPSIDHSYPAGAQGCLRFEKRGVKASQAPQVARSSPTCPCKGRTGAQFISTNDFSGLPLAGELLGAGLYPPAHLRHVTLPHHLHHPELLLCFPPKAARDLRNYLKI